MEFKGKKSLLDLAGLKIELEELLKKKVDVRTYNSLHPLSKERILNEQEAIIWVRITRFLSIISTQIQDAVIRRIKIIGEAVKNIPQKIKDEYPDVPWKRLAGMRDILIHEYFGVI